MNITDSDAEWMRRYIRIPALLERRVAELESRRNEA